MTVDKLLEKSHNDLVRAISELHRARRRVHAITNMLEYPDDIDDADEAKNQILSAIRTIQFVIGDIHREQVDRMIPKEDKTDLVTRINAAIETLSES